MQADYKVVLLSLAEVPVVTIFERDRGNKVPVLYVPVRTDYEEKEEQAVARARKIAEWLTDDIARKKSNKSNQLTQGESSHGIAES